MTAVSRGRLQGYLAGRTAVLVLLVALAAVFQARRGGFPVSFSGFFAATALSFGFTVASALALRTASSFPQHVSPRLQPAWDVLYSTALVYLSGGASSPFVTLYPLTIIGGAILLFRKGALLVATASGLAYGILVDLQFMGVLEPLNPFPLPEPGGAKLLLQLIFNLVAFYAIAFLSGYLAEELRRTGERLEEVEAEVLDLEHLKESILLSLGSGLVAIDRTGQELFHNRSAEELLSRAGIQLRQGADISRLFDLQEGERNEAEFLGGQVTLGYTVSPLFDRKGQRRGSILIFQDLTGYKRLEEDLRRSDRLAAVGRLAAGLAHEIRNPLGSLSGSVEVLRQSINPAEEDGALFGIVLKETGRLNQLVTNFLHYARPGRTERSPVPLRDAVAETGFFLSQGEGKRGFTLVNDVQEGLELAADPAQLNQLLLNLFRNSIEASPNGVTVTVEARQTDGVIHLSVRDDGPGMGPAVADRVFEPFFTSKEGGTGLGLATVHRIAESHGGSVTLHTAEGRGTAFHFRFPLNGSWKES